MLIRVAVPADVDAIMETQLAAIRELCSAAYPPDEIAAWTAGGKKDPERWLPGIREGRFSVALLNEAVVGFSDFDPGSGEIRGLFVAPSHARRGIGRALLNTIEAKARQIGRQRLHLQASLNSVDFYARCGFLRSERGTFCLRSGIRIPCASMYKQLENA